MSETVLQIEHEVFEAIARRDLGALAEVLADDFTYRSPGGPDVGKTEFLRNIEAIPVEILAIHGEALRADDHGEVVVVTGIQRATTRAPGRSPETSGVAFTDVFVRRGGRWLLVLAYGVDLPAAERNSDESIAPSR